MRYRVHHVTEYRYVEAIPLCHNVVHLRPRSFDRQRCLSSDVRIAPYPAVRSDRWDFFGNHVTLFAVQEPHQMLSVTATSEVEVSAPAVPALFKGGSWEEAAATLVSRRDEATLDALQYSYASPQAPRDAGLASYALPSFAPGQPLLQCALDLNARIYREFKYDKTATDVGTPVLSVLGEKRGVCQDFAHVMIGCLRSLGLAARYVSGYLLTAPSPGREKLVGADASHAWVSVFLPDFGWLDFDPTNGKMPTTEHVTVAWARDYDDVAPVKGVILGGRRHELRVSVDVAPV